MPEPKTPTQTEKISLSVLNVMIGIQKVFDDQKTAAQNSK